MVKKAENKQKRSPLTPIFGVLLAVGLFAVAYFITSAYIIHMPQVAQTIGANQTMGTIGLSIGIWVILLAIAFFLVAVMAGKDPESATTMPLPPKSKSVKKGRR
jgi:hypothetical protein